MEVNPLDIFAEVDRIADPHSTTDELWAACEKMRRLLKGNVPSVTLSAFFVAGKSDTLKEEVEDLQRKVTELLDEKCSLESQIERLREQIEQVNRRMIEPVDGFYTMEQFMFVLLRRLRRSYGWRTDYVTATQETTGCTPVLNEMVQKWKNHDQVPTWAVEEIDRLSFRSRTGRSGVPWSDGDETFLRDEYQKNPLQSNLLLAQLCEQKFRRTIGENAVKGALDRLRRQGKLPKRRPLR